MIQIVYKFADVVFDSKLRSFQVKTGKVKTSSLEKKTIFGLSRDLIDYVTRVICLQTHQGQVLCPVLCVRIFVSGELMSCSTSQES